MAKLSAVHATEEPIPDPPATSGAQAPPHRLEATGVVPGRSGTCARKPVRQAARRAFSGRLRVGLERPSLRVVRLGTTGGYIAVGASPDGAPAYTAVRRRAKGGRASGSLAVPLVGTSRIPVRAGGPSSVQTAVILVRRRRDKGQVARVATLPRTHEADGAA